MVLVAPEVEEVALCAGVVVPEKPEARGILASHTIGVLELKGVNSARSVQDEVNLVLGLGAPVEDRVLKVVVVVKRSRLLVKEGLNACSRR